MDKRDILNRILSYIEDNLEKEITWDMIAGEVCYSKFYIARIFKENTGCTLHKYIRGRRLTEAARYLAETDMPIIEIAYEAHYTSQQAFTKAFEKEYRNTPQTYRKKGRFYPKQSRITMKAVQYKLNGNYRGMGGQMAA